MRCQACRADIDHVDALARHVETCGTPFRPSDVVLVFPPLVDTVGRFERETAAALIVLANEKSGDTWGPVSRSQVVEVVRGELDRSSSKSWVHWLVTQPFGHPDFDELVEHGYARWCEAPDPSPVSLTAKGIAALYPHVRRVSEQANGVPGDGEHQHEEGAREAQAPEFSDLAVVREPIDKRSDNGDEYRNESGHG